MFQFMASGRTPVATDDQSTTADARLIFEMVEQALDPHRPIVIGRDADCGLAVDDTRIAKRHAEVYRVGKLWWLRDLGSSDGTYLDGEMIEAVPLAGRSEIRLGETGPTLQFSP